MVERMTVWRGGIAALLLLLTSATQALHLPPLSGASEDLTYRISYRGFFTAFVWKDLADMHLYAYPATERFLGETVCRATMTVNTEHYSISEFAHPVRLRYDVLASPTLDTSWLLSDRDDGEDNIHDIYWFNWGQNRISSYKKRRYLEVNQSSWDNSEQYIWSPPKQFEWEKDGNEALPAFLRQQPDVDDGLSYFIHSKTKRKIEEPSAVDPLTMLYGLRVQDYLSLEERPIAVVHDAKVGLYQARLVAREAIKHNGKQYNTLHVRVKKQEAAEGENGQLDVWLSDDSQRVILRMEVQSPVGLIRVELVERQGQLPLGGCVDVGRSQWAKN